MSTPTVGQWKASLPSVTIPRPASGSPHGPSGKKGCGEVERVNPDSAVSRCTAPEKSGPLPDNQDQPAFENAVSTLATSVCQRPPLPQLRKATDQRSGRPWPPLASSHTMAKSRLTALPVVRFWNCMALKVPSATSSFHRYSLPRCTPPEMERCNSPIFTPHSMDHNMGMPRTVLERVRMPPMWSNVAEVK